MYTMVLASLLIPAVEAPDRGGRGCRGGGYAMGCWGGGCWGGYSMGCWGGGGYGTPVYYTVSSPVIVGGQQGGGGSQGGDGQQGDGSDDGGSQGVKQAIKELKKEVDEIRKAQTQQRVDLLKLIAEELQSRRTDQELNEIRRDIESLRHGGHGVISPSAVPLPMPLPQSGPRQAPVLPPPRTGMIELQLPADTLLHVNNEKVELANSYVTPALEPGRDYYYDFDVCYVRDGKAVTRIKRVTIHAGEVIRLSPEDMHPPRWSRSARDRAGAFASLAGPLPLVRATVAP